MSDVVEQLRREAKSSRDNGVGSGWLEDDAADEIERLREFINELDIQTMHAHMNGEHQCSIRASGRCLTRDQWAIVLDCRDRQ